MSNELTDDERARVFCEKWQHEDAISRLETHFAAVRADERQKCEAENDTEPGLSPPSNNSVRYTAQVEGAISEIDRKKIEFVGTLAKFEKIYFLNEHGMYILDLGDELAEIRGAMKPPTLAERAQATLNAEAAGEPVDLVEAFDILREFAAQKAGE